MDRRAIAARGTPTPAPIAISLDSLQLFSLLAVAVAVAVGTGVVAAVVTAVVTAVSVPLATKEDVLLDISSKFERTPALGIMYPSRILKLV